MMKKILLSVVVIVMLSAVANAQTQQGSIMAGGNVSLDFENVKQEAGNVSVDAGNQTTVNFNPVGGYFIIDGLAVGLDISLSSQKFKAEDDDLEVTNSSFALGPFVKYYHDLGFFGKGSFGVGSAKSKRTSNNTTVEETLSVFTWRLGGGYALFLNDNVSVEPMLSYGAIGRTDKDEDPEEKTIYSGFRFSVGFQIFLN